MLSQIESPIMKKQIAIIAGGDSSEHDVSLRSAAGILSFMDTERYECCIVEQKGHEMYVCLGENKIPVSLHDFTYEFDGNRKGFDFAYITIHGTPGENGILQGYFDLIGIPYSTSGVLVEALTFNKFTLNNYLRALPGVQVSDSIMVRRGMAMPAPEHVAEKVGLPCFIKPNAGGSSFGVSKVKTCQDIIPAIEKAMKESDEVIIEKQLVGKEITCGCFRRKNGEIACLPITEVVVKGEDFFDYKAKYEGKSEEITPARIASKTAHRVQETTQYIYTQLGCYGLIRIDYILSGTPGEEQINLLEINTTPGMTPASFIPQQVNASEFTMAQVLSEIIEGRC